MEKQKAPVDRWPLAIVGMALLVALAAGCSSQTNPSQASVGVGVDVGSLRQTVVAQQTQVSSLQRQVVALQTAVPALKANPAPAAQPAAPAIPTLMPPVAGLVMDGTTKGPADAKVTITEYSDFQ